MQSYIFLQKKHNFMYKMLSLNFLIFLNQITRFETKSAFFITNIEILKIITKKFKKAF